MNKLYFIRSILAGLSLIIVFQSIVLMARHFYHLPPSSNFFWGIADQIQIASLIALFLVFIAATLKNSVKKYEIPLVLMLSAGISNLFEKIVYKGVTDYIPLLFSVKSNLADLALTLGVIVFTIISLRSEKEPVVDIQL